MKIRWLTIAAVCLLFLWPASGQPSWTTKATATIPFSFVVNGTTLPAGDYRIMTYLGKSLMIQNVDQMDQQVSVQNQDILLTPDGTVHENTKLIFLFNDGQHVLHQITILDDNHIHDIIHGHNVVELVATR